MRDYIAYWKSERTKLQAQLNEIESAVVKDESLPLVRYLKTRIGDIDRHIASLEKRRV